MTETPPDATRLAVDRTRLAYERTLMAWIRTAVSLISFGFTIYKFFQFLRESRQDSPPEHILGPHLFAIMMIVVGLTSLSLAWIQHHQQMKGMRGQFGDQPYSLAGVIAAFITGLGVVALVVVALRF